MRVSQAVDDYRYSILDLSPPTQRWYVQKLELFAEWCDQEQIDLENLKASHVRRFIEGLRSRTNQQTGKTISSYTLRGYAQVIKGFLNWCAKEDGLEELVSEKTPKRIELPRVDAKVIETFTPDQIKRLFAACEKEFTQTLTMRDKAILSVLLDTGIRASELVGLTLDNVFLSAQDAYIRVFGKGRKEREVGLGKEARIALHRYITRYRQAGKEEQHVFLSRFTQPLTVNGLDQVIYRLGEWARISGVRCSAHTFRHTYAVSYLQAGGDVYKLSRLLGHTGVQVTENYLKAFKARDARMDGLSVLDTTIKQK
jgi:site-specific recombinase XerD